MSLESCEPGRRLSFESMVRGARLGPTVEDTILELKAQGHNGVFVPAIGFLCDHLEVLYDMEVGFREFAQKHSMRLWRAESLRLIAALAARVRARANA
jgi:ferrochelatase